MSQQHITSAEPEAVALRTATSSKPTHTASSSHAAHATHAASHAASSEEHLEDFSWVDIPAHTAEACSLVSIVVDLSRIIHLLLLGVGEAAVRLGGFLEFAGGFFLFSFALVAIAIWVVFESQCFVRFFDFGISGIAVHLQDLIVIFFLGLFFFLLGFFNLGPKIGIWINLLKLVVVHDGCSVLSTFHIELCTTDQRLIVIGIELQGLVEVIKCFEGFLAFHEGKCAIGVDDCIKFLVGRVQVDGFGVFGFRLFEFAALDELISLLLQLLTTFGGVQSQSALLVVGIEAHALGEELLGSAAISAVQLDDALQVPEIR